MGMGSALMFLGLAAISSSLIATFATVLVFGILLLLGAIFQVVTAFGGRGWRGFFLHLLTGILYLFLINNPIGAALGLTLLVAICLLAAGVVRLLLSLIERFGRARPPSFSNSRAAFCARAELPIIEFSQQLGDALRIGRRDGREMLAEGRKH